MKNGVFWDVTRVALVRTEVLEELSASFIRERRIGKLEIPTRATRRNIPENIIFQLFSILQNSVFWLTWKCISQPLPSNGRLLLLNYQSFNPHGIVPSVVVHTYSLWCPGPFRCCHPIAYSFLQVYQVAMMHFRATRCWAGALKHYISEGNANWNQSRQK
jgi:hypothetical protein